MQNLINAKEIAKKLISIDTSRKSGVKLSMNWIEKWCQKQNLSIKKFAGTQAMLIETNPDAKLHFNFVTHIDVALANNWKEAFLPKIKNGFLFGRGAVDDKGPLAICLEVLLRFRHNKKLNVSCLIVTDEETENKEIQEILKSGSFSPTFSLVVDGGTHQLMDIGQKGIIRCEIEIEAEGGHSAFEEKDKSAVLQIFGLIKQLHEFGEKHKHDKEFSATFINISSLVSDAIPYGLPEKAVAHLEIQFPSPQTSDIWLRKLEELKKRIKICTIHISWASEPHFLKDKKILKILKSVKGINCVTTGGNNLAKDICLAGIPAASHCPVEEYVAHCRDEKIKLTDFEKGKFLYLNLVKNFTLFSGH